MGCGRGAQGDILCMHTLLSIVLVNLLTKLDEVLPGLVRGFFCLVPCQLAKIRDVVSL
jgi:hypothetical protein